MLEGSVLLLVASNSLTLELQKSVIPPPWLDAEGQTLIQSSPPSFELKVHIPVLLLQPWLGHRDPHRYRGTGSSVGTGVPRGRAEPVLGLPGHCRGKVVTAAGGSLVLPPKADHGKAWSIV